MPDINQIIEQNKAIPFVDRIINRHKYPVLKDGDYDVSHKMADAEVDGKYIAFPTVAMKEGKLTDLSMAGLDPVGEALKSRNFIEFKTPEEAQYFSKHYKQYWNRPFQRYNRIKRAKPGGRVP